MQHSRKWFMLLGLMGLLTACGLPRASDINPPLEPQDPSALDDPLPPLIIPAPAPEPTAPESPEAVESEREPPTESENESDEPAVESEQDAS
ncbi:MAG: hypothetical protein ACPGVO_04305 [Spirulinaceae cyanobacterium]